MAKYTHLSSLVFNQPLLVTQDYAETIAVVLSDRLDINTEGLQIKSEAKDKRSPSLVGKKIKVIPIVGSMSHRSNGIEAMSGMTSYSTLQDQFEAAFSDPNVGSILMDIDSPGGAVAGAFDFRDYLMANKGRKPVYALARDNMCSAAYLIGSTADKVYATQTSRVGSIGVVAMHLDRSEKNKQEGIKPTFISAGKYKVAGNPHEALEGDNLKYLQDSVDESYGMFINAVAEARGLSKEAVKGTEARVYSGDKAVKIGLVDGIRTFDSVIEEMSNPTNLTNLTKGKTMSLDAGIEQLEAETLKLRENVTKLTKDNETLRKQVLDAGFKITAEGLEAAEAKELLMVEGEMVDASVLPASVVKALKDKAKAEVRASATSLYPNLKADVAEKLYVAFNEDASMKEALAGFNSVMGSLMEEAGDTTPGVDLQSAQDQFDSLVKAQMAADGTDFHTAYAKVAMTDAGKKLITDIYKEKE